MINKKVSEKRIVSSTPKYCCRDGPNGKTYTFFQEMAKPISTNKILTVGRGTGQKLLHVAYNEGKAPDGLFYNRSCKAVDQWNKNGEGRKRYPCTGNDSIPLPHGPKGNIHVFRGMAKPISTSRNITVGREQAKAYRSRRRQTTRMGCFTTDLVKPWKTMMVVL